jgi:hypothetical protein
LSPTQGKVIENQMRKFCIAIVLFSISCLFGADESPGEAKNIYGVLLQAIQDGDASVFQELGTEAFKKQMTPDLFRSAQNEIGIRLREGYVSSYLGKISKSNREIFLWKITTSRNSDQLLATLVLEKNKVAGFYFQ